MKKKFYYAGMLAAGLLTFASCNNDEDPIVGGGQTPTEETSGTEIVLSIANGGDGLTTRAGRPLLSSEAKQNIDKVTVVIYNKNSSTIIAQKTFEDWMSVSTAYGTATDGSEDHGRKLTWKLTTEERAKLPAGNSVAVYAVGFNTSEPLFEDIDGALDANSLTAATFKKDAEGNFFYNTALTTDAGVEADEIFAGEIAELEVNDAGEFDLEANPEANVIILRRQVTGTFGYFTNIPLNRAGGTAEDVNNLSLRLVSSNASDRIALNHFNNDFIETGENVMYVVNGWAGASSLSALTKDAKFYTFDNGVSSDPTAGAEAYTLYTINLSEWFTAGDTDGNGLLGEGDSDWNTPYAVRGAEFEPGSVFTGKFLIPFKKVMDNGHNAQTLQLQLVKDGGTAATDILRVWDIKLASTDPQVDPAQHVEYINGISGDYTSNNSNNDEMTESYSLVRNHLYTVGAKATDEYDPDTDEPEDLSKGQNIILKVNDNWELIHKLVVD